MRVKNVVGARWGLNTSKRRLNVLSYTIKVVWCGKSLLGTLGLSRGRHSSALDEMALQLEPVARGATSEAVKCASICLDTSGVHVSAIIIMRFGANGAELQLHVTSIITVVYPVLLQKRKHFTRLRCQVLR